MAVRDDFTPGEKLKAADLNDTFADVRQQMNYIDSIDLTSFAGFPVEYEINTTGFDNFMVFGSAVVKSSNTGTHEYYFNNDSGANSFYKIFLTTTTPTNEYAETSGIALRPQTTSQDYFLRFGLMKGTGVTTIQGVTGQNATGWWRYEGVYTGGSPVTSITLYNAVAFTAGTIHIYGG